MNYSCVDLSIRSRSNPSGNKDLLLSLEQSPSSSSFASSSLLSPSSCYVDINDEKKKKSSSLRMESTCLSPVLESIQDMLGLSPRRCVRPSYHQSNQQSSHQSNHHQLGRHQHHPRKHRGRLYDQDNDYQPFDYDQEHDKPSATIMVSQRNIATNDKDKDTDYCDAQSRPWKKSVAHVFDVDGSQTMIVSEEQNDLMHGDVLHLNLSNEINHALPANLSSVFDSNTMGSNSGNSVELGDDITNAVSVDSIITPNRYQPQCNDHHRRPRKLMKSFDYLVHPLNPSDKLYKQQLTLIQYQQSLQANRKHDGRREISATEPQSVRSTCCLTSGLTLNKSYPSSPTQFCGELLACSPTSINTASGFPLYSPTAIRQCDQFIPRIKVPGLTSPLMRTSLDFNHVAKTPETSEASISSNLVRGPRPAFRQVQSKCGRIKGSTSTDMSSHLQDVSQREIEDQASNDPFGHEMEVDDTQCSCTKSSETPQTDPIFDTCDDENSSQLGLSCFSKAVVTTSSLSLSTTTDVEIEFVSSTLMPNSVAVAVALNGESVVDRASSDIIAAQISPRDVDITCPILECLPGEEMVSEFDGFGSVSSSAVEVESVVDSAISPMSDVIDEWVSDPFAKATILVSFVSEYEILESAFRVQPIISHSLFFAKLILGSGIEHMITDGRALEIPKKKRICIIVENVRIAAEFLKAVEAMHVDDTSFVWNKDWIPYSIKWDVVSYATWIVQTIRTLLEPCIKIVQLLHWRCNPNALVGMTILVPNRGLEIAQGTCSTHVSSILAGVVVGMNMDSTARIRRAHGLCECDAEDGDLVSNESRKFGNDLLLPIDVDESEMLTVLNSSLASKCVSCQCPIIYASFQPGRQGEKISMPFWIFRNTSSSNGHSASTVDHELDQEVVDQRHRKDKGQSLNAILGTEPVELYEMLSTRDIDRTSYVQTSDYSDRNRLDSDISSVSGIDNSPTPGSKKSMAIIDPDAYCQRKIECKILDLLRDFSLNTTNKLLLSPCTMLKEMVWAVSTLPSIAADMQDSSISRTNFDSVEYKAFLTVSN